MLIDAHAHLDRYDLAGAEALEEALAEIERNRIFTISNSMDPSSYQRNMEISRRCDWVLPAFGVHPWNASHYAGCLSDLEPAVEQSSLLGEIGLDYFFVEDASAYPAQRKVFEFFLSAARSQHKIVMVHTKGAERDALNLLDRYGLERVIVHWYSGPMDVFRELAARGVYFTVGVEVLHSAHIQTIAREIPAGRLLTETDNPGGPQSFTGVPGKPGLLREIVRRLAEARATTIQAIEELVLANVLGLVQKDPGLQDVQNRLIRKSESGS